jgi:hypothetical protein
MRVRETKVEYQGDRWQRHGHGRYRNGFAGYLTDFDEVSLRALVGEPEESVLCMQLLGGAAKLLRLQSVPVK